MNANNLQQQASDPNSSVWVSASAGTGKTKILTDRVLRLLLNKVPPEKILCITFTNAAAQEMQERIYSKLYNWSKLSASQLKREIALLGDNITKQEDIIYVSKLYYQLLEQQKTINIYTIHSFCQKILKNFPVEAGISPGFAILNEIDKPEIIEHLKNIIEIDEQFTILNRFLTANFHENTIKEIISAILENRLQFQQFFTSKDLDYTQQDVREISIAADEKFTSAWKNIEGELYKLQLEHDYILENNLTKIFYNKDNTITKKFKSKLPNAPAALIKEIELIAQRLQLLESEKNNSNIEIYSKMLTLLASILLDNYSTYKQVTNVLDYDDMIFYTQRLLSSQEDKDWVLYKLDGGIDHLLVDEAQDTSKLQWQIIADILGEFYSGQESRHNRTIFVVGDEKQSIFSFQGADINNFTLVKEELSSKFIASHKNFAIINLELSYRSLSAILNFTFQIFTDLQIKNLGLFDIRNPKILSARKSKSMGRVELWPLVVNKSEKKNFWQETIINNENLAVNQPASTILAGKIAHFIKTQIDTGVILPATGMPAKASDFLLLVCTRDQFFIELINHLQKYQLEISGIDRISLNSNLAVLDLISTAKFVLNPDDDLNIAHLIKSPIMGGDDSILYDLCTKRGNKTIWQFLLDNIADDPIKLALCQRLNILLDIYKRTSAGNFFHWLVDKLELRQLLMGDNVAENCDAINEFLYLAYDYAVNRNYSVQAFIFWFENNQIEIKRNISESDKIRLMTVHGAKGLQAPVVILCDTTSMPHEKAKFIWNENNEPFYSVANNKASCELLNLKEINAKKAMQEYMRLFYVALTRAEDYLVVCGYNSSEKLNDYCWYSLARTTMQSLISESKADDVLLYGDEFIKKTPHKAEQSTFIFEKYLKGQSVKERILTSKWKYNILEYTETIVNNQNNPLLLLKDYNHFDYGKIFHKILEDFFKYKDTNIIINHPLIKTLSPEKQDQINYSIKLLLNNSYLMSLIQYETKTEVNIGIEDDNIIKTGRIDLLAILGKEVVIIDYKSDSQVPTTINMIPLDYIYQLQLYHKVIKQIYPDYNISCKILWLKNATITDITKIVSS